MPGNFLNLLEHRLQQPLPGLEAQLKMAHVSRRLYKATPTEAKQAGVLATLFPKNEEWHLILIERKQVNGDRHGGQIGFPGGRFETEDETLLNTALRETEEEIGISRQQVKVLGGLTDIYIPVSNFQVHPYVGYLDAAPTYLLQETEVSGVLEVPLSHFQNPSILRTTDIQVSPLLTLKRVPYFDIGGKVLWGATAMMLNELIHVMNEN
jgi:8-oxo-dGTP pyrophosphatase MutT (NUDIX family)